MLTGRIDAEKVCALLGRLYNNRNCNSQSIANALYGVGKLAEGDRSFCQSLKSDQVHGLINKLLRFNASDFSMNISVCAHLLFVVYGELSETLQNLLLKNCRPEPQKIQHKLVKLLQSEFKGSRAEAEALVGAWFVDVVFEHQGKRIIIELDGVHHSNKEGQLGIKDVNRDKVLRREGCDILRVKNNLSAEEVIDEVRALISKKRISFFSFQKQPGLGQSVDSSPEKKEGISVCYSKC